tara:strand:+ start:94 stop:1542 length:1449 start_codon:yes stop_codon:yes gene_type:complete
MTSQHIISPESMEWALQNFLGAFSSDKRRHNRLIDLAARMNEAPGKTIPQLAEKAYDVKAYYNLLKHNESTPDFIQQGHRGMTIKKLSSSGTYLLIEDGSDFSWSGNDPIQGLGPLGDFSEGLQGFVMHSTIAVEWQDDDKYKQSNRPPLAVLGIADQQYFTRRPGKKKSERKQGAPSENEPKETDAWFHSMDRIGKKPEDSSIRWVRVCDRAADIFEQFSYSSKQGYDYIIRSVQNRALETKIVDQSETHLKEFASSMKPLGQVQVYVRKQKGREDRTAILDISAGTVTLRHPYRKDLKSSERLPITLNIVYVKETDEIPDGIEPITWLLVTSLPVSCFEEAREVARMYSARWLIEEFHKTLKSGLKAEELQLKHAERLYAAISIMSVVAISLVELKELGRLKPDAPADECNLSNFELDILSRRIRKSLKTINDVVMALGRLGGHMNRKRDGTPGLLTLWRGWACLKSLVEGARLVMPINT